MEIDKKYDHLSIEKKWYQFWEEKGFFKADPSSKKPPLIERARRRCKHLSHQVSLRAGEDEVSVGAVLYMCT